MDTDISGNADTNGDLVALLMAAGDAELKRIDEQIAALKQEIDEFVASRRNRMQSLSFLRRAINAKIQPRPKPRSKAATKTATKRGPSDIHVRVYDLLAAEGSLPLPVIAQRLGMQAARIGASIWHSDWFERRDGEVHIAKKRPSTE